MTYDFQVTVDAAEPHTLVAWWAETLGWQVEPSDEAFIRKMIDQGYATEADTTRTVAGWCGRRERPSSSPAPDGGCCSNGSRRGTRAN